MDNVKDVTPNIIHIHWNPTSESWALMYFRIQYKPNNANSITIGSINMNLDCVKSALSEIKINELIKLSVSWMIVTNNQKLPQRMRKAAKIAVHCLQPNCIIKWYARGTIKLPQRAGIDRNTNTGTFAAYSLPILSNLKVPEEITMQVIQASSIEWWELRVVYRHNWRGMRLTQPVVSQMADESRKRRFFSCTG